MWRQQAKQRLEAAAEEMSGFVDKTGPDYDEEERCRLKEKMQENEILDAVLNPSVRLHRLVFPADVQQTVLIKEEAPEEWSSGVDQKDPETLNIKEEEEERRISLDVEQLSVKEETDDTMFSFTTDPLKSEDDEEKPLFSQLHQHQVEDGDLPTSSSADQVKAATGGEDCGGAEISKLLEKSAADYEEKRSYLKEKEQQTQVLDAVLNPKIQLCRLDVLQAVLIAEIVSEECRPGVDQQDPETLNAKFLQHQVEDRNLPTSSSADHIKAATDGGTETTRNPYLNIHKDDSSSSETEDSADDDEDVNDSDTQLKDSSDSGSEPEGLNKDCKESRAPESGVNTVSKSCRFSECGKQFIHKKSVQSHKTGHSRIRYSSYLVSKECFSGKKIGGSSRKVKSKQKLFSCDDCGKRFITKYNLNRHVRIHTGEKPFVCDLCGQKFGRKSILKTHMRIHTGQKPFACDVCGKKFGHKSTIDAHMRIHTGQKPFACDVCGQRFSQRTPLNRHVRSHTGQKPFVCDVCGKKFRHNSTLNGHKRIHAGQKPFVCDVCGQRFRHMSHLTVHGKVHTGRKNC